MPMTHLVGVTEVPKPRKNPPTGGLLAIHGQGHHRVCKRLFSLLPISAITTPTLSSSTEEGNLLSLVQPPSGLDRPHPKILKG